MNPLVMLRKVRRWVMWNPRRFRVVAGGALAVVLLAIGAQLLSYAEDLRWAKYEAEVARYNAEVAREARSAAEDVAVKAGDTAERMPGFDEVPAAKVTEAPEPTATTTTAVPSDAAVQKVAGSFLAAWAAGSKAKSNEAWLASMRPYVTPGMLASFELTDHSAMPAGLKATNLSTVVTEGQAATVADVGVFGQIKLSLEPAPDGTWLVSSLVPSDGH